VIADTYDVDLGNLQAEVLAKALSNEPTIKCDPPLSDVPSQWFNDYIESFCPRATDPKVGFGPIVFDIYAEEIKKRKRALQPRSPPEEKMTYDKWRIGLQYEAKEGECIGNTGSLCRDSFVKLVQSDCKPNPPSILPLSSPPMVPELTNRRVQAAQTMDQPTTDSSLTPPSMSAAASTSGTLKRRRRPKGRRSRGLNDAKMYVSTIPGQAGSVLIYNSGVLPIIASL
jgi:hypothetical protein